MKVQQCWLLYVKIFWQKSIIYTVEIFASFFFPQNFANGKITTDVGNSCSSHQFLMFNAIRQNKILKLCFWIYSK